MFRVCVYCVDTVELCVSMSEKEFESIGDLHQWCLEEYGPVDVDGVVLEDQIRKFEQEGDNGSFSINFGDNFVEIKRIG